MFGGKTLSYDQNRISIMEKRRLGRTDHMSTVITMGTAGLGKVSQETADSSVDLMMKSGINHIDIAPTYGEAMERLAPWMPKIRSDIFLGSKTKERTKDLAWANIESCLDRLGVDSFDLFQLHAVTTMEELDAVTRPGGALEALIKMREEGLTKWIGITGHGPEVPRVHLEALNRFNFDTIMFPISASIFQNHGYRTKTDELMAEAKNQDVGIQTIKMLSRGGWGIQKKDLSTWYDAHRSKEDIEQALWWVLSQPMHTAPSTGEVTLWSKILEAANNFVPLSESIQEAIITRQQAPNPEPKLGILT